MDFIRLIGNGFGNEMPLLCCCTVRLYMPGITWWTGHAYFYQVQTQLFLCDVEYTDFVLWVNGKIHLERITPDIDFWEKVYPKAHEFFQKVILFQLSGQFFTRIPSATTPVSIIAPKRPLCLIPDPAVCATLTQPTTGTQVVPLSWRGKASHDRMW